MKIVVANWKMNLGVRESAALAKGVLRVLRGLPAVPEVILAPTFPALPSVGKILSRSRVRLAAQTMHAQEVGAFTGDVSVKVLKEVGVQVVIIGHSEQRRDHGETDHGVHIKVVAALAHGLDAIVCVGEPLAVHDAGESNGYVHDQLQTILKGVEVGRRHRLFVAYEPLWAIGTGHTPTLHDIEVMHDHIRTTLSTLDIAGVIGLYGGSVRLENAYELLHSSHVDGVLVGEASARMSSLTEIIRIASERS